MFQHLFVNQRTEVDVRAEIPQSQPKPPASLTIIDNLPAHLSDDQRKQPVDLVRSYEDIFPQNDYDIGRTHSVEHTIETGDQKPIRQPTEASSNIAPRN